MVVIGRIIVSQKMSFTNKCSGSARAFSALLAVLFACGAIMLCVSACRNESFEAFVTGPFDTVTKIILFAGDQSEFDEHRLFIEQELWRYHQLFDIYNDYPGVTNIKTINDRAGSAVACSEDILDLIEFGIECEEKSGGRVNIAMGSVLKLWHDARTLSTAEPSRAFVPDRQALEEAARHTSIDDVRIDRLKGTVTLTDPLMLLDVGAIAKGYAVERIAESLMKRGIRTGALDAGGNVRVIGHNVVKNKPWRIGIHNPLDNAESPFIEIVDVVNRSVVTSGNDQRYFIFQGRRYSHIIDPATNQPAEYHDAVSVIAEDSGVADFLSTTLMLMTESEGRELLADFPDCEVLWVQGATVTMTEGFKEYVAGR